MLYDCFVFNYELDLLDIRLNVLNDIVDKFVLVEAGENHWGNKKPLYFDENKARFKSFKDKIIHIKFDKFEECSDMWAREHFQREQIMQGLKDANDDDIIMISDIDEIPNPKAVKNCMYLPEIKSLHMENFVYFLNNLAFDRVCTNQQTTKILFMRDIRNGILDDNNNKTTLSQIKFNHDNHQIIIPDGGWHFTSCAREEEVRIKYLSNALHTEETIQQRYELADNYEANRKSFLLWNCREPLLRIKLNNYFPEYILQNQEKFAYIIKSNGYAFDMDTVKFLKKYLRKIKWVLYHFLTCFMTDKRYKDSILAKLQID